MFIDKKRLYIISSSILALLLLTLFAPMGSGRKIAAVLLLPSAIITYFLIKKREALSPHSKQVLLVISVIGFLYFSFYYFSAMIFGFTKTGYGLKSDIILEFIIPIAIIIVCTEIIRYVICIQRDKIATVMAYLISLFSEILICATIPAITNSATFMDVVGLTLLPGISYNFLYNHLTTRYGPLPIIVYKAFTVWAFYLIPYGSAISNTLIGFVNLSLPSVIYFFIDTLYEKKRKTALGGVSRTTRITSKIFSAVSTVLMIGIMLLTSNHFKYGTVVIATESMTGELNKGDIIVFESYEGETLQEGQIIIFERNGAVTVHRIVEIDIINGTAHYYTKGDANEDWDLGYTVESDIMGTVKSKFPALGYPTIWIKDLFKS